MDDVIHELHLLNEQVSMHVALLYEVIESNRAFTEGFFSLKLIRDTEAAAARTLQQTKENPLVALSYGIEVQASILVLLKREIERIGG